MAEQPPRPRTDPAETDLEDALRDLGSRLAYPPTPDLSRAVRRRLEAAPARRPSFWARGGLMPRLALALSMCLLLVGAALALSPGARRAVGGRLGLPGIGIVYQTPAPTPPGAVASPTGAVPLGGGYRFGALVTLDEARGRASFPILAPTLPEYGTPDEVYYGDFPPGGQVALVYGARPGLAPAGGAGPGLFITQFRGDVERDFFVKGLGPGTTLEQVTVAGGQGYWIAGAPHSFFYRDARGNIQNERSRSVGNTLLWTRNGITYRLEANISKEEALRIAASMR